MPSKKLERYVCVCVCVSYLHLAELGELLAQVGGVLLELVEVQLHLEFGHGGGMWARGWRRHQGQRG